MVMLRGTLRLVPNAPIWSTFALLPSQEYSSGLGYLVQFNVSKRAFKHYNEGECAWNYGLAVTRDGIAYNDCSPYYGPDILELVENGALRTFQNPANEYPGAESMTATKGALWIVPITYGGYTLTRFDKVSQTLAELTAPFPTGLPTAIAADERDGIWMVDTGDSYRSIGPALLHYVPPQ